MEPWIAVNLPLLRLAVTCVACMWLLMAAFERETQRWKWAWGQPRKLLARNASETPRTLGVVTSHAVAALGWTAGLCCAGWAPTASSGLRWALLGMLGDTVAKTVAGWMAFKDRDLASTMVEVNRHNRTWQGLLLALWAVACAIQPWLAHADWAVWITWGWMAVLLGVGALRASSLVSSQTDLPGMLYLCIFEWGWVDFKSVHFKHVHARPNATVAYLQLNVPLFILPVVLFVPPSLLSFRFLVLVFVLNTLKCWFHDFVS